MTTEQLKLTPHYAKLANFIGGVNAKKAAYWDENKYTFNSAPIVKVESAGGRYAKICTAEQVPPHTGSFESRSLYCFYDFMTGDLLKGTWKAPVKNGVRGNVNEPNVLDKFTPFGPAYLK